MSKGSKVISRAASKKKLRAELKTIRLNLNTESRQALSQGINAKLMTSANWAELRRVHLFEPIARLNEVNIAGFINFLVTNYPDIELYSSRQFAKIWRLCNYKSGELVKPLQLDAVIVPMLGFDESLQRIGYGGGYYDKFLATQPGALKLGVCFDSGKIEQVPLEAHDVKLDKIITEKRVYTLKTVV